jgi:flagellin
MGNFSIINNIAALNAQNRLLSTNLGLRKTLNRLSSGLRINDAGDDAAGLAIADGLRADIRALGQAARNANDGVSLLQTADTALNEISLLLTRAVTLAEQAASGTSGTDNSDSKLALDDEFQDILSEIERISKSVQFNGLSLLSTAAADQGSSASISTAALRIQVGLDNSSASAITVNTISINVSGTARIVNGSVDSNFVGFTEGSIGTNGVGGKRISVQLGFSGADLKTASNAVNALGTLQVGISSIARARGKLGAGINRLNTTTTIIRALSSNLQSAESQIRDANIAQEIVNLTQYQILTQTGIAALAQANLAAQNVLSLLG